MSQKQAEKKAIRGSPKNEKVKVTLPKTTQREQLILFAISDRKVYGLEIQKHIERCTGGRQKLAVGALYPLLQSLEKKGLIKSEWGSENTCGARRRYHSCTDSGRAVIDDILVTQQRLLQSEVL